MEAARKIMKARRNVTARIGQMSQWIWIEEPSFGPYMKRKLAEHGGGAGVRVASLLASALARPLNLAA